jgi:hypothetical protein
MTRKGRAGLGIGQPLAAIGASFLRSESSGARRAHAKLIRTDVKNQRAIGFRAARTRVGEMHFP